MQGHNNRSYRFQITHHNEHAVENGVVQDCACRAYFNAELRCRCTRTNASAYGKAKGTNASQLRLALLLLMVVDDPPGLVENGCDSACQTAILFEERMCKETFVALCEDVQVSLRCRPIILLDENGQQP